MFWYCFRERETILDLFELVTGYRMHTRYFQAGGLAEDIPPGFYSECRKFVDQMPGAIEQYEGLVDQNQIWIERTRDVGLLSADDALALGQSGPVLRASGVDWDVRRDEPYLAYDQVDFDVVVYPHGDVYDRYRVRMDEMRESTKICLQALDGMPEGRYVADAPKIILPDREQMKTQMESLIHHFKIVTEGFRVPAGQAYASIEAPRGEIGCHLVSDGGTRPYRAHFRDPSFVNLQGTSVMSEGGMLSDVIVAIASIDPVMGGVDR
jgi:NADH-quinone oxidoreductase subunit D